MKTVRYVLSCCLLLLAPASGFADACSDLQAAIAKAAALKQEMQREAAPFISSTQSPGRHDAVCKAAESLRSYLVVLGTQIKTSQCLSDEQYKTQADIIASSMKGANEYVAQFCN